MVYCDKHPYCGAHKTIILLPTSVDKSVKSWLTSGGKRALAGAVRTVQCEDKLYGGYLYSSLISKNPAIYSHYPAKLTEIWPDSDYSWPDSR